MVEYTVYFQNKFVRFSGDPAPATGTVVMDADGADVTKVLQNLGIYKGVYIKSNDPRLAHDRFCGFFRIVEAGGGVVRNSRGELLLIHRRGVWDLPKGWRENGETLQECALREVAEECGLGGLKAVGMVATTEHIYVLDGRWVLKRCVWYAMTVEDGQAAEPQAEEDITEVRWAAPDEAARLTADSYATVKEVISKSIS